MSVAWTEAPAPLSAPTIWPFPAAGSQISRLASSTCWASASTHQGGVLYASLSTRSNPTSCLPTSAPVAGDDVESGTDWPKSAPHAVAADRFADHLDVGAVL